MNNIILAIQCACLCTELVIRLCGFCIPRCIIIWNTITKCHHHISINKKANFKPKLICKRSAPAIITFEFNVGFFILRDINFPQLSQLRNDTGSTNLNVLGNFPGCSKVGGVIYIVLVGFYLWYECFTLWWLEFNSSLLNSVHYIANSTKY